MLRTMPYMLPEMLGITIPVAMLFSVSSVFGRMTGANEVMALKSLGISPMVVVWPALVLAAFLSLGTVWMYEIAATWCKPKVVRIGYESIEEIAYSMLQKNRSFGGDSYPFSATVKRVDGRTLIQPRITIKGPPTITLTAAEAELRTDLPARKLWISFSDSEVDFEGLWSVLYRRHPRVLPADPRADAAERSPRLGRHARNPRLDRRASGGVAGARTTPRGEKSPRREPESARSRRRDRRNSKQDLPSEDRAVPPLGQWVFLPVLRADRHAGGHAPAPRRRADELLRLLPADPGGVLSAVDVRRGPFHLRQLPPISFWMANMVLVVPAVALLRRIIRH